MLIVGCGSGYSSAIFAELTDSIIAIDSDAELVTAATDALSALDVQSVAVVEAPLTEGYPDQAPYDIILIGGAVSEVPR